MKVFNPSDLKKLHKPHWKSSNEDNGQVTIIGGSQLFHGAPLLALKSASRIVDMVFFTSPEPVIGKVVVQLKSKLLSFIWVPWEDVEAYIQKSDAVLIGPGFMRFGSEHTPEEKRTHNNHKEGLETRGITERLLSKFPHKRWVIDAGSLQVIDPDILPKGCIITPNRKEFEMLFGTEIRDTQNEIREDRNRIASFVLRIAKRYDCTIVLKGPETVVCSPNECVLVKGGNPGLTKGGTGDVLAGLTVALLAQNDPFLSAASASYTVKAAGDELYKKVGVNYNADDLADKIPQMLHRLVTSNR